MAHTFSSLLAHVVFSTKNRAALIDDELEDKLHAYISGIIRELEAKALAIGGTADHVHILIRLPPRLSVSDLMRVVKTNSSRWVHENWTRRSSFGWQTGYGVYSVSESSLEAVIRYIAGQEDHHRRMSFQEEYLAMLNRHGIEYDERFVFE